MDQARRMNPWALKPGILIYLIYTLLVPFQVGQGVFFLLWPLFARAPRHWFLEIVLLWCFFLLWPRAGAQRGCSFPCLSPGPEQKKNTLGGVFFFALAPCRRPTGRLLPLPFAGAAAKKNTLGGVFFLLWPRAGTGLLLPLPFPGAGAKKKNTLGGVFFLLRPRADAHSLTAGLGGDASPSPGWCFFFCCGPARTGVVFFFLLWPRPDAHSLTVGWGDFGKARVVFFFFAAAPPGLFRQ